MQWLTTWGHDANRSLRELLDLPELPVPGTYGDADESEGDPDAAPGAHAAVTPAAPDELTGRWWKFDVVRRLVRAGPSRRLVWIDDDLRFPEVQQWMAREADSLLVVPDPRTGLVAADLGAVDGFLR